MKKVMFSRGMKNRIPRFSAAALAAAMVLTGLTVPSVQADAAETEYEIYPNPHVISYEGESWIIKNEINVVYEDGIDDATKARLNEVFDLKGLPVEESDAIVEGKTNVLVGIEGSDGYADQYTSENVTVSTSGLFDKLDSYVLDSREDVITVLGADTDASFYGLTTLYHIIKQMDSRTIRSFHIEDWADVASRGFIEGYYGNPWSTQDRCNLMEWGGYYKLNSYFYAPKDDPKHNASWRQLYTDGELETLIRPLADAGNASKCRFVYALHPFMSNPIRFDTDENYKEDLGIVQAKFEQVIRTGVRQIAVLADDAGDAGSSNYIRFLKDMSGWLEKMRETYPDLKATLPFCTLEYMGWGQEYYKQFPENVQIIMTGGTVWGKVTNNFTSSFTNTVGRGPYMWINWPCTDNSKNHLIMGGYADFLQPGVDPQNIQGIVLNPMQQSEPSKVAIFGNACYSWNIWSSKEEADQAWNDSFKYVDHNSAIETEASDALRELSKHMINQNMPTSKVEPIEESVELAPLLTEFRSKLSAGTVTGQDADALIKEFEKLQDAADTYEAQAGDTNIRDQIIYWLDCWDDTADAAIAYLNGVKAVLDNDTTSILQYNSEGKAAFSNSKTHEFLYLDHYETAEVGVQHIVPFINALDSWMSAKVQEVADPAAITQTYISNSFTNPSSGKTDNVLDGNDSTSVQFTEPNYPAAGDYFGIRFNRAITVDSLRVLMGDGKNHLQYSKLQYLPDGADEETGWQDVSGTEYTRGNGNADVIEETGLNLTDVKAVRLIAVKKNEFDSWVEIKSFDVNKQAADEAGFTMTASGVNTIIGKHSAINDASKNNKYEYITDGDESTLAWLASADPDNGNIQQGQGIEIAFSREVMMKEISLLQGSGDNVPTLKVEYRSGDEWKELQTVQNAGTSVKIDARGVNAEALRLTNGAGGTGKWWQIYEVRVTEETSADSEYVYTDVENSGLAASVDAESAVLTPKEIQLAAGQYIGIDFKEIRRLKSVEAEYTGDGVELQYSDNGKVWTKAGDGVNGETARYIRLVNTSDSEKTVNVSKLTVSTYTVGKMGELISSDIPVNSSWGDTRNNGLAFDGNMTTQTKFGGSAKQGNTAVYSFGQEIDIRSIRLYTADSTQDYIRDAKVQLSTDGKKWTDAFEIGDGVQDTEEQANQTMSTANAGQADSNYPNIRYFGSDDLDTTARYMRLYITANAPNRSIIINEVVVNGGAYISSESNMAFSGTVEEQGHQPGNMLDRDFSTTYRPSQANGSMTYKIDEPDGIRSFRIIQSGKASSAVVKAELYNDEKGSVETAEMGTLEQAINEFIVKDGCSLLSITVEWKDAVPDIAEILLLNQTAGQADKDELNTLLNTEPEGYDTWTTSSQEAYDAVKEMAKAVAASENISQTTVDSAVSSLRKAQEKAVVRADADTIESLKKSVSEKADNSNNIYTTVSYMTYENAVSRIEKALKAPDNLSQADAETLQANVQAAADGLAYSASNREKAELEILRYDAVKGDNYTTASYQALTDAYNAAAALAAKDKAAENEGGERVDPQEFIDARTAFIEAMDGLVDVTELKTALAQEELITDPSVYTTESYDTFKAAAEAGRLLLEQGTKEEIENAVTEINAAYKALTLIPDTDLGNLIREAKAVLNAEGAKDKYTEDSYNTLLTVVEEAEAAMDDSYVEKIQSALKGLVNAEQLKEAIAQAQAVEAEKYTISSHSALLEVLAQIEKDELLKSGSQEEINAAVKAIGDAVLGLRPRAQGVEDYRDSITLKPEKGYTADSYKAYKEAYEALMKTDATDLSAEEFAQLKADFEKAEQGLKLADSGSGTQNGNGQDSAKGQTDKKGTAVQTGDNTNIVPVVIILILCLAAVAAVVVIRKKRK